ncbi:MAG: hypothetical protein WA175_06195 [Candidatus Acidiferrales bacterium]
MNKKKRLRKPTKRVLDGYKKVGTTFVPPLIHRVGAFDYVSWSTQTMPELIWWDVLIDRASLRFAAKVAEEIGKYFKATGERKCWWAFISDYAQLSADDIYRFKEHMRRAGLLDLFLGSLADFLDLYPECPISRLSDSRPTGIVDVGYLSRFENRMKDLENKRSRNGVLVQAQAVYMGFVLGRLHVQQGMALGDFSEVEHYPTTDRSKQVGASICATVNMLVGRGLPKYPEDTWVQYFWRRSLELRPLNFGRSENQ